MTDRVNFLIAVLILAMAGGLAAAVVVSLMARRRKPTRATAGPGSPAQSPFIGGDPDVAERYYREQLARSEKALGPDHLDVAEALDALARFYRTQNRSAELEEVLRRVIATREKALVPDHPQVLSDLNSLASLHYTWEDYAGAGAIYRRVLAVHEQNQAAASHSPLELVDCLGQLGACAERQGEPAEAERFYRRALALREEASGRDHPFVVGPLVHLASFYRSLRRYDEAEALFRRIMPIVEASDDHRELGAGYSYAALLREMGRKAEAEALERRTRAAQNGSFDAEMATAKALAGAWIAGSRSEGGDGPT